MSFRRITTTICTAATLFTVAACSSDSSSPLAPDSNSVSSSSEGGSASSSSSGSAGSASGSASSSRTRIEVALAPAVGFPKVSGKAKWDSRGTRRELELEVEDLVPGTAVNFFVGGTMVGTTQMADSYGEARVERSTQLGHAVPTTVTGLRIEVRTAAGALVASGSF